MVSLDPTDYVDVCDVLPAQLSVLCETAPVIGVPYWMLAGAVVGTLAFLQLLALVFGR